MRELIKPISILYDGRDADEHRVDGLQLGQSLSGLSKVYNSIGHFHFHQDYRTSEHSKIRIQVGPPQEGSFYYLIYLMFTHGSLPTYPELFFQAAELVIPNLFKAMIALKSGRKNEVELCLEAMEKSRTDYVRLAETTLRHQQKAQENLFKSIEHLTAQNNRALAEAATPVGKSVKTITQIHENIDPILIDAPIAEALRAPETILVGETRQYCGVFTAIDKNTGNFKFEEKGSQNKLLGKITDPNIGIPKNIYTHSFDTATEVEITAKPTFKEDGELHKLFVSDAKI